MTNNWPSFPEVLSQVDIDWVLNNTERLWRVELGACYRHWHRAANFAAELMAEAGLECIEKIPTPADGKTVFLDRIMPLAWDVARASLTVLQPSLPDPVVASYERHSFHIVKGSSGTLEGGIKARLISEAQLFAGEDARGALVMLEPFTYPRADILRAVLDLGAIGFVADQVTDRYATPDALTWYNAATEGAHWHVQAEDRPFLGFAVSPRTGDMLRAALHQEQVWVRAESDARRYEGEFHTVTGVLPGREPRELWLMAHLYEPMPDDNSSGVVAALEVVRALKRLIENGRIEKPRFTLRVVLSMEMYGYAAYAAQCGVPLRPGVLGAINMDAISSNPGARLVLAPPDAPFCGDYLLEQLADEYAQDGQPPHLAVVEQGWYSDDTFLSDPATALPTAWLVGNYGWWHTSAQDMSLLQPEPVAHYVAFYATWLARMLSTVENQRRQVAEAALALARRHIDAEAERITADAMATNGAQRMIWRLERELARLGDFEYLWGEPIAAETLQELKAYHASVAAKLVNGQDAEPESEPTRDRWAASIVPQRAVPWTPYDQAALPLNERSALPDSAIYGPFAHILAHSDGRRNLKEIIEYVEWIQQRRFTPGEVRRYISGIERLAAQGQLTVRRSESIVRAEIVRALRAVGLADGDLVLVHTALSAFGYIEGGPDTVIDAFLEVLGETGTLLVPTFTSSVIYCDGEWNTSRAYRPFDIASPNTWVGQLSSTMLGRPGVIRSAHPTHSVAGIGPLAGLLHHHRETDAPTGESSPFGALVRHRGKMVWFGADLASTTFFHYLEDVSGLPYLRPALCRVLRPDGSLDSLLVPNWLPGHREFYRRNGLKSKMYQRLLADGLQVNATQLGLGSISLIDAVAMNALGRAALEQEPTLMLCDDPNCPFCRTARCACEEHRE